ncbi:MAG TPA: hypothetical protein VHH36_02625 [Candidatus Thermoplasmatota archaeon]|nr:hypothetical protein [Candidatus Thermoplasmatota archaeon]
MNAFQRRLLAFWADAAERWEALRAPVARETGLLVWNPQRYGLEVYARFAERHLPRAPGALLMLGLNPGKYGMSQTGVPFTDVTRARTLGIGFDLDAPGLAPPDLRPFLKPYRVERSSQSVYAFLQLAHGSVEAGWRDVWAMSPCGLLFLEPDGTNVTPADARLARREDVRALRLRVMEEAARLAKPRGVVLLGQDVAKVARGAGLGDAPRVVADHPVARGPGRRGPAWWAEDVARRLREARLLG